MMETLVSVILTFFATVLGAWWLYKGGRFTATASREAAADTARVDAQADALDAWKELLQPVRDELATVRRDLATEQQARRAVEERQAEQDRRMERLVAEVARWQQVARTIARWALQLRDEVLKLGGTVPATPEELLTLQAIDEVAHDDERAG